MMSRKSKKGFMKLNTHEMVQLGKNGQSSKFDSGSEEEIMDLTVEDHDLERVGGPCSSCCMWFSVLYVGLLTILVLVLGAFCGYILVSSWQMDQHFNSTTNSLRMDLAKLRDDFDVHMRGTNHILQGLQETVFETRASISSVNASTDDSLQLLAEKVEDARRRLGVIETHPREVLIKQIDVIHMEMGIMDKNMQTLNESLNELHDMRQEMASMGSSLSSYDAKLTQLSATIGDTVHGNTDMQDSLQGLADRLQNFSTWLQGMDSRINKSHEAMQKSMTNSESQFSSLKSLVGTMNQTMKDEMSGMWDNLTKVESEVVGLRVSVDSVDSAVANFSTLPRNMQQQESAVPKGPTTPSPTDTPTQPPPSSVAEVTTPDAVATTIIKSVGRPKFADEVDTEEQQQQQQKQHQQQQQPQGSEEQSPEGEEDKSAMTKSTPPGRGELGTTVAGARTTATPEVAATTERSSSVVVGGDNSVTTQSDDDAAGTTLVATEEATTTAAAAAAGEEAEEGEEEEEKKISLDSGIQKFQYLYNHFAKWDLDANDALDVDEFMAYFPMKDIFPILDSNGDGFVQKDELLIALSMLRSKQRATGDE